MSAPDPADAPPAASPSAPHAASPTAPDAGDVAARCPGCDYILTGLTENRCPECGRRFEPHEVIASRIPWEHRRRIGRVRAYLRTVWLATFDTRTLVSERDRPLQAGAARGFWFITSVLAWLPTLALWVGFLLADPSGWVSAAEWGDWVVLGSMPIGALLAVLALAGFPSYFFHPRYIPVAAQNRAIALSYYGCGVLAWMPLLSVVVALAAWTAHAVDPFQGMSAGIAVGVGAGITLLLTVAGYWLALIRLARAVSGRVGRAVGVALLVPLLWLLVGGFIAVFIPASLAWLVIVFHSLW